MFKRIFQAITFDNFFAYFTGILFTAIFFLMLLKLLMVWGIYLGLATSFFASFWLKRRYPKQQTVLSFANGILTLDIITIIFSVVLFVVFFSSIQNLLN